MTTSGLHFSYDTIVEKARSMGVSAHEARRIASKWHGQPLPPSMYGTMSWHSLFIETNDPGAQEFRTRRQLLTIARRRQPLDPGNRVTDFSGWVFRCCFPNWRSNRASLQMGKEAEERLLSTSRARHLLRLPEPSPQDTHWELVFRDPLSRETTFKISSLTVQGRPMFGVPDIVYRNRKTGEIRIVEIKASHKDIPANGWPNLRVQLWCYAHIDQWADAPDVTLVGQVWSPSATELRRTMIWKKNDPLFDEECRDLFKCYRSEH